MKSVESAARVRLARVGIICRMGLDRHTGKRREELYSLASEDGVPILLENGERMMAERRGNTTYPFLPHAPAAAVLLLEEAEERMLLENSGMIKLENQ